MVAGKHLVGNHARAPTDPRRAAPLHRAAARAPCSAACRPGRLRLCRCRRAPAGSLSLGQHLGDAEVEHLGDVAGVRSCARKMFSGFRSRCTSWRRCAASTAAHTCRMMRMVVGRRERALALQLVTQRRPVEQLHHQKRAAGGDTEVVHRHHVRMDECRGHARLVLKSPRDVVVRDADRRGSLSPRRADRAQCPSPRTRCRSRHGRAADRGGSAPRARAKADSRERTAVSARAARASRCRSTSRSRGIHRKVPAPAIARNRRTLRAAAPGCRR